MASSAAQFVVIEPFIGPPAPVSVSYTNAAFPLGLTARAVDQQSGTAQLGAAEFVFCQGSNVASRGQFVNIVNNSAVLLASGNSASMFPIGLANAPMTGTGAYGWVQIAGKADYATMTNVDVAAGVKLGYSNIAAGQVGSGLGAGINIVGLVAPNSYGSANSASAPNFTVQLFRPVNVVVTATAGV